ncbi:MAG: hypothetical protein AB7U20_17525 [Planctomycetaceae bacterium]
MVLFVTLAASVCSLYGGIAAAQSDSQESAGAAVESDVPAAEPVVRVRTLFHKNGQMLLEGKLVDDQRHGTWAWWYGNGQQFAAMEYEHGKSVGTLKHWSAGGELLTDGEYQDGEEWNGTFVDFDGDLNLTAQRSLKNGQPHGQYSWWHKNGNLNTQGAFVDGDRDGVWKWFYENSQTFAEVQFAKGNLTGTESHWAVDGTLLTSGEYRDNEPWNGSFIDFNGTELLVTFQRSFKDGQPHGEWLWWHADGTPSTEGSFIHGKKHGSWRWWYEGGQMFAETEYDNGISRGTLRHWSPEGKLLNEGHYALDGREWSGTFVDFKSNLVLTAQRTYIDGVKEGTWIEWHENGTKAFEATYQSGRPQGIWSWWDENGVKTSEERYLSALTSTPTASTN